MMMMENRENSLDRELIGHLQHVHFGRQQDLHQLHSWGEFVNNRFSDGRKDIGGVNGLEVRNKGPSPCNSQASLGYHSLPSSQCGSRPSSNPDYIVDYGTSSSYEQSMTYLDSPLANSTDPCWRHNAPGQALDMSVRGISQVQNVSKESIRRCIDMEWRNWCQQQQNTLHQNDFSYTGNSNHGHAHPSKSYHSSGHHSNGHHSSGQHNTDHSHGLQSPVGIYPKRSSKQKTSHKISHIQNVHQFRYQDNGRHSSHGRLIPHNHQRPSPAHCASQHHRYDEPNGRVEMLSKSLTNSNQFRTCVPPEDPIYEEIIEHNIIHGTEEEAQGPNLPPRPKSWTSMVNLHQKGKAPVYYQIEPYTQHNDSYCRIQQERMSSPTNLLTSSRGVCANVLPIEHYKCDSVSSINLPYFPYINRLFQADEECSDNNGNSSHERDSKLNEKKSGKIEKFFGSLLNLNKSKGVKNMGTSTEEITVEKHKKLRRTVSESCNIYSRGKGYEDDMCNLLKEIQINMKEIDHNSKKLQQYSEKDKIKNFDAKTGKQGERRNSRRDKKLKIMGNKVEKSESNDSRNQSGISHSPHHYARNSSAAGTGHSVNHNAIKTVLNDSNQPRTESCNNKSQSSSSHRKSASRPAMGVQALLTRSNNYGSPETTPNKSTEENDAKVDSFERRLSHERVGSRLSFVYDYSEGSDSDESDAKLHGVAGYASEAYVQGLASGEDNENWKDGDQVYGVVLAKPLFRNNVVATAKRRKLIEKVTEL